MSDIVGASRSVEAEFPPALACLFKPKRHKVMFGGRGAGRSWGCARALIIKCINNPIRVLCAREFQNSIAESVHKTLSDQIKLMGLEDLFEIQVARILTRPGVVPGGGFSSFSFEGIRNNTSRIKSYEGIDYCWVEEANKVSRSSWEILLPTIRKDASEIWMTFNPELETDYTYKRFVIEPSGDLIARDGNTTETTDAFVTKMTYADNPWFPAPLRREMEDLRKRDYDAYLNVWEGHCRVALTGAVFAKELQRCTAENRITSVPWDHETPVDTFWDLGRRDMTCIWFAQRVAMQWRVLEYFEDSQEDIQYYLKVLGNRPYNYGTHWLPHDAKAKRLTGHAGPARSVEQAVRASYGSVRVVPRINQKVNAINSARVIFPNCWFDARKCEDGLNRLRHYKYEVKEDSSGNFHIQSEQPVHDENSNGADAFMTMAQSLKGSKRKVEFGDTLVRQPSVWIDEAPALGWLAR